MTSEQQKKAGRERAERIEKAKKGSRIDKQLGRYSDNFKSIFRFFLVSYRKEILTFCGSPVNIDFVPSGTEAMFSFREFENGRFRLDQLRTRHSNVLTGVITAKKAWGLLVKQWAEGIGEGSFTKWDFMELFLENGIGIPVKGYDTYPVMIPEPFWLEFENAVTRMREKNPAAKEFISSIFHNGWELHLKNTRNQL